MFFLIKNIIKSIKTFKLGFVFIIIITIILLTILNILIVKNISESEIFNNYTKKTNLSDFLYESYNRGNAVNNLETNDPSSWNSSNITTYNSLEKFKMSENSTFKNWNTNAWTLRKEYIFNNTQDINGEENFDFITSSYTYPISFFKNNAINKGKPLPDWNNVINKDTIKRYPLTSRKNPGTPSSQSDPYDVIVSQSWAKKHNLNINSIFQFSYAHTLEGESSWFKIDGWINSLFLMSTITERSKINAKNYKTGVFVMNPYDYTEFYNNDLVNISSMHREFTYIMCKFKNNYFNKSYSKNQFKKLQNSYNSGNILGFEKKYFVSWADNSNFLTIRANNFLFLRKAWNYFYLAIFIVILALSLVLIFVVIKIQINKNNFIFALLKANGYSNLGIMIGYLLLSIILGFFSGIAAFLISFEVVKLLNKSSSVLYTNNIYKISVQPYNFLILMAIASFILGIIVLFSVWHSLNKKLILLLNHNSFYKFNNFKALIMKFLKRTPLTFKFGFSSLLLMGYRSVFMFVSMIGVFILVGFGLYVRNILSDKITSLQKDMKINFKYQLYDNKIQYHFSGNDSSNNYSSIHYVSIPQSIGSAGDLTTWYRNHDSDNLKINYYPDNQKLTMNDESKNILAEWSKNNNMEFNRYIYGKNDFFNRNSFEYSDKGIMRSIFDADSKTQKQIINFINHKIGANLSDIFYKIKYIFSERPKMYINLNFIILDKKESSVANGFNCSNVLLSKNKNLKRDSYMFTGGIYTYISSNNGVNNITAKKLNIEDIRYQADKNPKIIPIILTKKNAKIYKWKLNETRPLSSSWQNFVDLDYINSNFPEFFEKYSTNFVSATKDWKFKLVQIYKSSGPDPFNSAHTCILDGTSLNALYSHLKYESTSKINNKNILVDHYITDYFDFNKSYEYDSNYVSEKFPRISKIYTNNAKSWFFGNGSTESNLNLWQSNHNNEITYDSNFIKITFSKSAYLEALKFFDDRFKLLLLIFSIFFILFGALIFFGINILLIIENSQYIRIFKTIGYHTQRILVFYMLILIPFMILTYFIGLGLLKLLMLFIIYFVNTETEITAGIKYHLVTDIVIFAMCIIMLIIIFIISNKIIKKICKKI